MIISLQKRKKETKVLINFRLFLDFSYAFVDIDKSHFPLDTQSLLALWTFLSKILVMLMRYRHCIIGFISAR